MMIDVLHEMLGLTGSRLGCGQGICHACVVIWDSDDGTSEEVRDLHHRRRTSSTASASAPSKGIAQTRRQGRDRTLSPVQQAFLDQFSFQCGYCTPGFVNAATVLIERLKRAPVPRERGRGDGRRGAGNHICRCTGYVRYYEAVRDVILATPGLVTEAAQ